MNRSGDIIEVNGRNVTFYLRSKTDVAIKTAHQFLICKPENQNHTKRMVLAKSAIKSGNILTASELIDFMGGRVIIMTYKSEWYKWR